MRVQTIMDTRQDQSSLANQIDLNISVEFDNFCGVA